MFLIKQKETKKNESRTFTKRTHKHLYWNFMDIIYFAMENT
jgi:hypothetical protein